MVHKKDSRDCDALNCLGFLNLYGINIDKNEDLAEILFTRSANYGNTLSRYIVYKKWNSNKIEELFSIANKGYGNAINMVGYKIGKK